MKLLVLVSRSLTHEESEQAIPKVREAVNDYLENRRNMLLIHSSDWYRESFEVAGNWDSWIWETVTGRDYATREKHFDGFVVYGDRLGRANAGIVDLALRNQRAVLAFQGEAGLGIVNAVVSLDPEDMVSGWTISIAPQSEASA